MYLGYPVSIFSLLPLSFAFTPLNEEVFHHTYMAFCFTLCVSGRRPMHGQGITRRMLHWYLLRTECLQTLRRVCSCLPDYQCDDWDEHYGVRHQQNLPIKHFCVHILDWAKRLSNMGATVTSSMPLTSCWKSKTHRQVVVTGNPG